MSGATSPDIVPSTPATTPPTNTSPECSRASSVLGDPVKEETVPENNDSLSMSETEMEKRLSRLQFVLDRSAVFSTILKNRMDEEKARQAALQAEKRKEQTGKKRGRSAVQSSPKGKRKKGANGNAVPIEEPEVEDGEGAVFQQPALITGAKLKPYQLEGLQWMVSLDQNGISGILADEMGLGKTLQTIAFSAYLREHHNSRPFLIVCPLSVLHNWVDEYKKFAPDIPVCMYHGTPEERAELRRTVMSLSGNEVAAPKPKAKTPKKKTPVQATRKSDRTAKPVAETSSTGSKRRGRPRKSKVVEDEDEERETMDVDKEVEEVEPITFPIVLTTYEMIIKDRTYLSHYDWGYIVVDEGHRLKNLDCKLMKEIKKYQSAGRMILTGTPLHNNLGELWALLNFILPDIFDDVDTFEEWFDLPQLQSSLPTSQSSQIISSLHAILKPFLLRRLKVDVETNLPPKKEYVLYAPLSMRQREAYDRVLDGGLRKWLIQGGTSGVEIPVDTDECVAVKKEEDADGKVPDNDSKEEEDKQEGTSKRRASTRFVKGGRKSYAVDGSDREYFKMLERGELDERGLKVTKTKEEAAEEEARIGREHQERTKDPNTMYPVLGEELVNASGKMMVLDRLLRELFKRKHKVLLFSQFTTMLDIIEDWAVDYMGWPICRIDGSTAPQERREQMNKFQNGGDDPNAPCLFLLSTRAGGLGINLVAADTVIFYDQDWNPQMDAQAQDRAHRIGQTKPVLIYRLVSAHTIETKIMQRATEKRKLEALVIAKGKFRKPAAAAANPKRETMADMAASLLRLEGEKIDVVPNTKEGKQGVLSDEDLDLLLDRRPEVFAERGQGWTSGGVRAVAGGTAVTGGVTTGVGATGGDEESAAGQIDHSAMGAGKKAAFAVYEAPAEEGNDALAKMMAEVEEAS
ncbi:Lymphoid-specific helicase [Psilocybe cubensis]|uniref:Lymphoid-specific helicase n=1 Tax=Psilocybe cubensis TaxID=181762 RepID=A0ACB8GHD3_PSICU|nr:Lymphoid-specific helicase [Psilocybe cubensis]KAH9475113.1 Lymphoid-specific helicase [Psilocybe cubensis]